MSRATLATLVAVFFGFLCEAAEAVQITKPLDGATCPVENPSENAYLTNSGRYAKASGTAFPFVWSCQPVGSIVFNYDPDPYYKHTVRIMCVEGNPPGWGPVQLIVTDTGDGSQHQITLWPIKVRWDLNSVPTGPHDRVVHNRDDGFPAAWWELPQQTLELYTREMTVTAYGSQPIQDLRIRMYTMPGGAGKVRFLDYDQDRTKLCELSEAEWKVVVPVATSPTGALHSFRFMGKETSARVDDIELDLVDRCPQEMHPFDGITAVMLFTVVEVDLYEDETPDAEEENPGAIVCRAVRETPHEHSAVVTALPEDLDGFELRLRKEETGGPRLGFEDWAGPVTLVKSIDVNGDLDYDFFMKGLAPSAAMRDIKLWIELFGGDGQRRGGQTCWDRVDVTVVKVDVNIWDVDETDEETAGMVVIRRHDGNNAPRWKVTVEAVEPAAWDGSVELRSTSGRLQFHTAESGGSQVSSPVTLQDADLAKSYWVQGDLASSLMRDAPVELCLTNRTSCKDIAKFTVLWVSTVVIHFGGTVSEDDSKRDVYRADTIQDHYALGGPQVYITAGQMGWGTEARGTVGPEDFSYPTAEVRLDRDGEWRDWQDGQLMAGAADFSANIPLGNDSSDDQWRDDNPAPYGFIYDLDAAGLPRDAQPINTIRRTRTNFKAYAIARVEGGPWVRCSPIETYYLRFSMKQTASPNGTDWAVISPPDVSGDNQAGYGSTALTWNLE